MKSEEMKNPETRDEIEHEGIEIDLEKDGGKVTGGDAIPTRASVYRRWLELYPTVDLL